MDDVLTIARAELGPGVSVDTERVAEAVAEPLRREDGRELYPGVVPKAAALLLAMLRLRPFGPGNARVALLATVVFLNRNGLDLQADDDELIALVAVAAPAAHGAADGRRPRAIRDPTLPGARRRRLRPGLKRPGAGSRRRSLGARSARRAMGRDRLARHRAQGQDAGPHVEGEVLVGLFGEALAHLRAALVERDLHERRLLQLDVGGGVRRRCDPGRRGR